MNRFAQLSLPAALLAGSLICAPETQGGTNLAPKLSGSWSLQPINRPALPAVQNNRWPRNPIDHFILAKLEPAGLKPSPEAGRATLMRRLSFDLTGLPPTPGELDTFVRSKSPKAYEELVERLLASPQYGERWGRHWLDIARYTETQGFEYDHMRENAWPYRDYVIKSFNQDQPYDRFMREQIAGDVLDPVTTDGIVATSLLVCGAWDQAGNGQANVAQRMTTREEEMEDMISVVGQTFLGLTLNCARCHSHKFDPIPQEDYYRIKAVFDGVRHGETIIATPAEVSAHETRVSRLKEQIGKLEEEISNSSTNTKQQISLAQLAAAPPEDQRSRRARCLVELDAKRAELKLAPPLPVSYSGVRKQPEPTHKLKRGDVRTPEEIVAPGALSAITELSDDFGLSADAPEAERRRRFADWLADPRNPLPARVMANRLWHYHFGNGIVSTPNDFGASGSRPSHPELLDWLASELIARGWSIKALHRLIVTSATYRQGSEYDTAAVKLDADNQLLWRFTPRRLEAEALRDAMLAVSGELNFVMGGPSFRPFDTKSFNATFYFPADKLGPPFNRRTVYRMNVNSGKDPMLESFDCPDPSVKTPRRGVTTTPLQALSLMNNSFVQRQAERLAERVLAESRGDTRSALRQAYRYCLARLPSAEELKEAEALARTTALTNVCWALLNSTEFLCLR